ncbi:hypothetical protein MUO56_03965 [Candidatus Bathyarchaeota archaeon]|jgi:hypothetical protein|nr:hypothetical protein [Candidatus Bathyarchaeota archaeon]
MLKRFRDKIAFSGITVLMIGVALLIFTFISAYGFLTQNLSIVATQDLVTTFGGALAPLITTCIHIMYLGVMGWIGSLITIRGVTIIAHAPQKPTAIPQKPPEQPQPIKKLNEKKQEKEQEKRENKQKEPDVIVIPPEEVTASVQPSQGKNTKQ